MANLTDSDDMCRRLREWVGVQKSGKWPQRSLDDDLLEAAKLIESLEAQLDGWLEEARR